MDKPIQIVTASDFFLPCGLTDRNKDAADTLFKKFKGNKAPFSSPTDIQTVNKIIKARAEVEKDDNVLGRLEEVTFHQHVRSARVLLERLAATDLGPALKIQNAAANINGHIEVAKKLGASLGVNPRMLQRSLPTQAFVLNSVATAHVNAVKNHLSEFTDRPGREPRVAEVIRREIDAHYEIAQEALRGSGIANSVHLPDARGVRERLAKAVAFATPVEAAPT